jgi:GxxExxY protein
MEKHFDDAQITHMIIGCAMRVHTELGNGFQEVIYQRALAVEFQHLGISFLREHEMPIYYSGVHIGTRRVDFFVEGISVELKAIVALEKVHLAQAINYLEAYNVKTGLLINFGAPQLQFHRLTNKKFKPDRPLRTRASQRPTHSVHPTHLMYEMSPVDPVHPVNSMHPVSPMQPVNLIDPVSPTLVNPMHPNNPSSDGLKDIPVVAERLRTLKTE